MTGASNMVYYELTGHGDIQPNTGSPRRRSKVSSCEAPLILFGDLSAGLKITQWNLTSMAPREGNMKLDQQRTILHDPIKDTHIRFVMNMGMLLFLLKICAWKSG